MRNIPVVDTVTSISTTGSVDIILAITGNLDTDIPEILSVESGVDFVRWDTHSQPIIEKLKTRLEIRNKLTNFIDEEE